jgi:hypothetical protein
MRGRCAMRGAFPRGFSKDCERALRLRSETRRTQFPVLRIALHARAVSQPGLLVAWSAAFTGESATARVCDPPACSGAETNGEKHLYMTLNAAWLEVRENVLRADASAAPHKTGNGHTAGVWRRPL